MTVCQVYIPVRKPLDTRPIKNVSCLCAGERCLSMTGWLLLRSSMVGQIIMGRDINITEEAVSVVSAGDWIQDSKRYQNPLKIITTERTYNTYLVQWKHSITSGLSHRCGWQSVRSSEKKDVKNRDSTVYELASQVKILNTVLKKNDVEE